MTYFEIVTLFCVVGIWLMMVFERLFGGKK